MISQPAPIAFFAYKRPNHTLQSLTSLAMNPGAKTSRLFVFCDGPRTAVDEPLVRQVREIVRSRQWCSQVSVIEQKSNLGLARSVVGGVTQLVEEFGRVIVLEDDLLVSQGFLDYMNRALEHYHHAEQVYQISGHMFPALDLSGEDDAFFMPMITSWGWATWERAWEIYDPDVKGSDNLRHDKALRRQFDLDGHYPYSEMLNAQTNGEIDSWAIKWWWSVFRNHGLCLFPKSSLVKNIGFSGGGTHTQGSDLYYNDPHWSDERVIPRLPVSVDVHTANYRKVQRCLLLASRKSMVSTAKYRLRRLLKIAQGGTRSARPDTT